MSATPTQYGNPPVIEKVGFLLNMVFRLPPILVWTLATKEFHRTNRHKTWTRVLGDRVLYFLTKYMSVKQLQWSFGLTGMAYSTWAKQNRLPIVVDELSEDTRLLWIGPQRTDRVILYLHGGAFLLPMTDFAASFWKYIQAELSNKNIDVGVAILQYTLVPSASFPTPLKQTVAAIEHLMSTGVQPRNLYITGDSAGANLALQVISHLLHPLEGVRPLHLPSRIGGILLMSPWVKLSGTDGSMALNDDSDIIGTLCINDWGKQVLSGIPHSQLPYIEASRAPNSWFKSMDTVVERVLITAGSAECLWDSIEVFAQKICSCHSGATFLMQEHGVHNDPFLDFLTKEAKKGKLTTPILEWFITGFSKAYDSE